ncbi:MAG: hypothetical protein EAZ51_02770 [Sphingobacteriales bacterium]|nr:MAG: hypothetical protein EAZ64_05360 [Sphingobacteriales bacterium]TAF82309.1 MAG: hypothetical protein EAZ51_02770 [Sphingobacteriales bacterium]
MLTSLTYLFFSFIAFKTIKGNLQNKVLWFIFGILLLPPGINLLGKPLIWFFLLAFTLSLFINNKGFKKLKHLPLKKHFLFYFVCLMVVGLFDSRLNNFEKIIRPILYFFENIWPCLLVYLVLFNAKEYKKIYIYLSYIGLFLGLYGIFCYLTKTNIYITAMSDEFKLRNLAIEYLSGLDDRVRISSFLFHPFLYGILLVFLIGYTIFLYQNNNRIINKNVILLSLTLLIINLLLTNSRTVIFVLLLQITFYFFLQVNSKNILIIASGAVFGLLLIFFIPALKEKTDLLFDLFQSGGSKVEGSSVEMRQGQLLASFKYFFQNPYTGNGFGYIYEGIGFKTEIADRNSGSELFAFESYFFVLLIEQGVAGIISNIVLFFGLITYSFKNYNSLLLLNHKRFVLLSAVLIICYLVFILGTGTINSLPLFFSFMGISLSLQQKLVSKGVPNHIKANLI